MKLLILSIILIAGFFIFEISPQPALSQNKPTVACSQYPSRLSTPSAKDPKIVDQEAYKKENATWDYRWEADCTQGCSQNSDCTKNTSNQPAVNPGTSAWCFQFTDGNKCMMLTTTDKTLGEDKNKSGGKFGKGGATPGKPGETGPGASKACKEIVKTSYYDAKVANNLVRYYAIIKGVPDYCVPADLGVGTQENIEGKRLLLCSGAKKGDELPDLVWRLADADNKKLIPAPGKTDPSRDLTIQYYIESGKLGAARKAAGLPEKEPQ